MDDHQVVYGFFEALFAQARLDADMLRKTGIRFTPSGEVYGWPPGVTKLRLMGGDFYRRDAKFLAEFWCVWLPRLTQHLAPHLDTDAAKEQWT